MFSAGKRTPLLLLTLFFILTRVFFMSRTPYEWDSVNYALGITHFSIPDDQPHPPGSILYITIARGINALLNDNLKSLLWLNFLFSLAGFGATYRAGRLMGGTRRAGFLAAFFFAVNPFVWFYGEVAEIYTVEAAFSVLCAFLLYRFTRDKEEKEFLHATLLLGLTGGFRMNAEIFLLPLWTIVLLRYRFRPPFLSLVKYAVMLTAVTALWFVPTVIHCDGFREYQRFSQNTIRPFFEVNSLFYGAAPAAHGRMFLKLLAWSFIGAGMLVAGILLIRLRNPSALPDRKLLTFLLIWAGPAVFFYTFIYIAKPGYLLFVFPAVFVLAGIVIDRGIKGDAGAWIFAALLAFPGVLYLFSPGLGANEIPYQLTPGKTFYRLFRYSLNDVRFRDGQNAAFREMLTEGTAHGRKSVFIFSSFYTWNFRFANYYFPEVESHLLIVDQYGVTGEHARFRYSRIFPVRGGGVELRNRDAYLFIHEISAWGRALAAAGLSVVSTSPDVRCFFIPADTYDAVDFSSNGVRFTPLNQERKLLP